MGPAGLDAKIDSEPRSRRAGGTYDSRSHFFAAPEVQEDLIALDAALDQLAASSHAAAMAARRNLMVFRLPDPER